MFHNDYNGCGGKFNWRKFWLALALWVGLGVLWLAWWPESGLADPPAPSLSPEQLEEFWQETYGDSTVSTQQFDQFLATLDWELLAKAQPDECYNGMGSPYPAGPPCDTGQPKVNQAYVWGLAKSGDDLWFGTAANVHCLVLGNYLNLTLSHETDSWVCEFGASQLSQNLSLPAQVGDWRPPHLYVYNTQTKTLTEKTGDVTLPGSALLSQTLGIRSAGAISDVVIFAGPAMTGGLNMFAFSTTTGNYLGFSQLPDYNNIRKWVEVDGALYVGVGNTAGGGRVLRWRGDATNPFQSEIVGILDGFAAELAEHEGRLFVSTWPTPGATMAGLWMSPAIPAGGLTTANAASWTKVWQVDDYEPDPVTAATYGGGALASYGGYLYWGTMHVPFLSTLAHITYYQAITDTYPLVNPEIDIPLAVLGTYRPISIFRGQNFDTSPEIELLYGLATLPVASYDPLTDYVQWQMLPNKMDVYTPTMGLAGFGNFFNNYTWTMNAYQGQLFVGTMDWSYLGSELLELVLEPVISYTADISIELPSPIGVGADLFRFPNPAAVAVPESIEGVGNYTNYGVRTMIADDSLYLGMANPMNLLTDPTDDRPEGGWELLRLTDPFAIAPTGIYLPIILKQPVSLPDLVGSFTLTPNQAAYAAGEPVTITVVITNQGVAAANPFWVDFYINPNPVPTAANLGWNDTCNLTPCYGLAWGVDTPLGAGQSITLTSTPDSYDAGQTRWFGSFAAGTTDLYLYVDSWNPGYPNGAVQESDETNNRAEQHGLSVTGLTGAQAGEVIDIPAR